MNRPRLSRITLHTLVMGAVLWVTLLPARAQTTGSETGPGSGRETAVQREINVQIQTIRREVEQKGHSFTVGYNPAMEIPLDRLCGLKEPENGRQYAPFTEVRSDPAELPSSFDWRWFGNVSPIRNQGSCGACWAFATVAPLESAILRQCGVAEDLSEQYLLSCNTSGFNCSGGRSAHDYHQWKLGRDNTEAGAVLEQHFPYVARRGACTGPYSHPYKIDSWSAVAGTSIPPLQAIKQAIMDYGPVAAGVCAGETFHAYTGGIFDYNEKCSINHLIVLVGWQDEGSPEQGYWILRNSWGAGWGEAGYMRIRYGMSRVGYGANFVVFSNCLPGDRLSCRDAIDFPPDIPLDVETPVIGDTTDGPGETNQYGNILWDESGPESVYRLRTSAYRDISVILDSQTTDLDVFVLNACGPDAVVAYGDSSANYANAPPGTYFIVVDGRDGAFGAHTLIVKESCPIPAKPGKISAPTSDYDGRFRVSWPWVPGATNFVLQRALSTNFANAKTVNTGSLNYRDVSGLGYGKHYFRVKAGNDCGKSGRWSNTAVVVVSPPPVTVKSPNGGEIWKLGTTKTIQWSYATQYGNSFTIDLYRAGQFSRFIDLATGSKGSGSYSWYIGSFLAPGNDYQIKITNTASSAAYEDTSNGYFSLVQ